MFHGLTVVSVAPAYNEEGIIGQVVAKVPTDVVDTILVVDDGSTDGTAGEAVEAGALVIRHGKNRGLGAAIRTAIDYASANGFDVIVIMAGNGKDDPAEIPRLLEPIATEGVEYVQGSRYLDGGRYGNMPLYRLIATKVYPWVLSLILGTRLTDCTNGFRAYRTSIFDDPRIDIHQAWLDAYDLELYLHYKVHRLKHRTKEVPVSKIYIRERGRPYSKVKPITGWWSMLRPIVFLGLGLKR
jgi:dolichol-phosphate mannosyltransferase